MSTRHYAHWPRGLPHDITIPATSVYVNLAVSAARYPDKPALVFYDTAISFGEMQREVDALAGYLQRVCGVGTGDRVLRHPACRRSRRSGQRDEQGDGGRALREG